MVRTQIYLNEQQKSVLERLSVERKATVSDLIRQAVDQFIGKSSTSFEESLERSFGIWRKRSQMGKSSAYVRKLRSEWEKRQNR